MASLEAALASKRRTEADVEQRLDEARRQLLLVQTVLRASRRRGERHVPVASGHSPPARVAADTAEARLSAPEWERAAHWVDRLTPPRHGNGQRQVLPTLGVCLTLSGNPNPATWVMLGSVAWLASNYVFFLHTVCAPLLAALVATTDRLFIIAVPNYALV